MPLSPLLPPVAELSAAERTRYARHLLLPGFGGLAQRRLRAARVLVIGAGGLGAPVLQYLAAAGVGRIGIVDDDVVEETNLQRQVVHRTSDIGRPKVESAARAVRELNPDVEIVPHRIRLDPTNILDVAAEHDLIVDGADNFPTRYLASDAAVTLGMPHVWGSIFRYEAQLSVWWAGQGPCYRCIFPVPPAEGAVASCAVGGVLGAMCGVVGSLLAGEVIKLITGVGEPLVGRLLVHDSLTSSFDLLPVSANPRCPSCGPEAALTRPLGTPAGQVVTGREAVPEVDVGDAARWLSAGALLLDVREPGEREVVTLEGSVGIPIDELAGNIGDLPRGVPVLVHCKTGARSAGAVVQLRGAGIDAYNVTGGILEWVRRLRPDLSTY